MSKYVIDVVTDDVDRPATIDEWLAAAIVREIRDEVDRGERP